MVNRGRYQTLFANSVRSIVVRLTAFLGSTYLCEDALSHTKLNHDNETV